jgi:hypothetical protein
MAWVGAFVALASSLSHGASWRLGRMSVACLLIGAAASWSRGLEEAPAPASAAPAPGPETASGRRLASRPRGAGARNGSWRVRHRAGRSPPPSPQVATTGRGHPRRGMPPRPTLHALCVGTGSHRRAALSAAPAPRKDAEDRLLERPSSRDVFRHEAVCTPCRRGAVVVAHTGGSPGVLHTRAVRTGHDSARPGARGIAGGRGQETRQDRLATRGVTAGQKSSSAFHADDLYPFTGSIAGGLEAAGEQARHAVPSPLEDIPD